MSGADGEGAPPPEVPEEFAAAYREAYERALQQPATAAPDGQPEQQAPPPVVPAGTQPAVGSHRTSDYVTTTRFDWFDDVRHSRWFVPALLTAMAIVLILGAYLVGRALSGGISAAESGADTSGSSAQHPATHRSPWQGKVEQVAPVSARAGCTAKPGVDASGHEVSYAVANVLDDDPRTAWRCDGTAVGQKIVLHLPEDTEVGEVGLIPGYAKTDAKSHADRYAENNRITRVRWTLGDTEVVQKMSGSATDRSLRTIRVPRTRTDRVTLEILAVAKGPRNTTAISAVHVLSAR